MNENEAFFLAVALIGLGVVGHGLVLFTRWMDRPLTDNDRFCAAQDEAIVREAVTAQRLREDREQIIAAMRAALDEERRGLEADFHWAGVEAEWHAFIDGWPTLEDAR